MTIYFCNLPQKLRMHKIIPPKIVILNAIFTFVAFFLNGQKAACTWNDLRLIKQYCKCEWWQTGSIFTEK